MKQTLFIKQLSEYFDVYLPSNKKCAKNTIASYADGFATFFQFFKEEKGRLHYRIGYSDITAPAMDEYVLWMQNNKNYSVASQKQRVSALSAFLKYASGREIEALSAYNAVSGVQTPKIPRTFFYTKPLLEYMKAVPDPRCGRKTKHNHAEVLVCLVIGFLVGRTTIRRSLKWYGKHLKWLRKAIPLENGIASPATACRILAGVDEELFALEFMEWIGEILDIRGIHLAIDGKALRAAMEKVKNFRSPMVMNAIDTATGLVIAQLPIQNKDCEIKAIPELLKLLDIRGSTVTTDAVCTQTEIMKQILVQEGHFVLMVKKNQPQSYEEIMKYFGELSEDYKKWRKTQKPGRDIRHY